MIGATSLKQVGELHFGVPETGKPAVVEMFKDGITVANVGSVASADPEAGRLMLKPGFYLILAKVDVAFGNQHSAVTLSVTLDGDKRFKGPKGVASRRAGHVSVWGTVHVPAGPPVSCDILAEGLDSQYTTQATFAGGELVAIQLTTPSEVHS